MHNDVIIEIAKSQLGIKEEPAGSNNVLYNTDYYGREVSGPAYPWCVVFGWWVFRQAGLSKLFFDGGKVASCTKLIEWAKPLGMITKTPIKGDIVIYQFGSNRHFGLVDKVTKNKVYSYEGNTGNDSDNNGGEVMYRTRDIKSVLCFIHPKYSDVKTTIMEGSVWSQPSKQDIYKVKTIPAGYNVTCLIPEFSLNGETWYKTIKGNYVLSKLFKEGGSK